MRSPSVKTFQASFPALTREQISAIKAALDRDWPRKALGLFNDAVGFHGTEVIDARDKENESWRGMLYANSGDSYRTTLLVDYWTGHPIARIGNWGSWVESRPEGRYS